MPNYIDTLGHIHHLDSDAYSHLLPAGTVPISDDDLAALRASQLDPAAAIRGQIADLEATVTPRRMREAVLSNDYSFIEDVDQQIAALRSSL